jgi:predicted component of type VI protein secretion system
MKLELTVLRCPDSVAPEARTVNGGEFSVGRGPGVDWILPDGDRLLSKRHFALAFRSGSWQLADTSTNGTFINTDDTPLGSEVRVLRDGDRVRLGAYEIEVRLAEDAFQSGGYEPRSRGYEPQPRGGADPFGDPFGMDPLAPPAPAHQPFGGNVHTQAEVAPILPEDDFLHGAAPSGRPGYDPFRNPVQEDHSSVMQDAFQPPRASGQTPMHSGGVIPGDDLLPDNWDNDLLEGIGDPPLSPSTAPQLNPAPAPPPPPAAPPRPVPQPVARPMQQPIAPPPAPMPAAEPVAFGGDVSPFDEPSDLINGPHRLEPNAVPLAVAHAEPAAPAADFDEPEVSAPPIARSPARPLPAPAPPKPEGADSGLLAAFMEGAGLPEVQPTDPEATMRSLGAAFRAVVSGVRAVLIARASIKSEFRIEQTMIRARGNNPLKFSSGDDDALSALLGTGRRVDMAPAAAVTDALRDIRLHELASMAAMQSAVRALMEGLDPVKLRAAADQGGGMTVLPAQRKARAWDAFEALHTKTTQALSDDFDSVFGKAFARAYERAMDEVSVKERE